MISVNRQAIRLISIQPHVLAFSAFFFHRAAFSPFQSSSVLTIPRYLQELVGLFNDGFASATQGTG